MCGSGRVHRFARELRVRICDRLIKSQRLDIAAKLAQRVKAFSSTTAGITHEIIEAILARDDNKVRDAVSQADPHNNRISASEVGINELVRREVFLYMPHALGPEPRRA